MVADNKNMNSSSIHRALVFQGGGSLGAYEAGAYKEINEELSRYLKAEGRGNEQIFSYCVWDIYRRDKRGYIGKLCEGK